MVKDVCYEICGDGLNLGFWWCDDGNYESGDGCSSICHIERGWECTPFPSWTSTATTKCKEICGDGIDQLYYECDDGNLINGDGCSSTCTIETGYTCWGGDQHVADKCYEICGDGITVKTTAGKCDDGNIWNGDGCSEICLIEIGWVCGGGTLTTIDTCYETCGDGMHAGGLACDDGNLVNGDGCSSTCTIESGW